MSPHLHAHHAQSPKKAETHIFQILAKSSFLKNLSRVDARFLKIYEVLAEEMKTGLHALRIKVLS